MFSFLFITKKLTALLPPMTSVAPVDADLKALSFATEYLIVLAEKTKLLVGVLLIYNLQLLLLFVYSSTFLQDAMRRSSRAIRQIRVRYVSL